MVEEEEFHDRFACLFDPFTVGEDFHAIGDGEGAGGLRFGGADDFDETHTAVTGDKKAFVVAEAWNFNTDYITSLKNGGVRRDRDGNTIDC